MAQVNKYEWTENAPLEVALPNHTQGVLVRKGQVVSEELFGSGWFEGKEGWKKVNKAVTPIEEMRVPIPVPVEEESE